MNKKYFFQGKGISLLAVMAFFAINGCQEQDSLDIAPAEVDQFTSERNGQLIEGSYIVVLKEGALDVSNSRAIKDYALQTEVMHKEVSRLLTQNQVNADIIKNVYSSTINGFSARLDKFALAKLQADDRVKYIEQDKIIALAPPPGKGKPGGGGGTPPPQETPWGISRVGGAADGGGLTAWVIDSGIDLDHPDLNVDVQRSRSFLGGKDADDPNDSNGHGTHVAGTIAAIDNSDGVVGVAAGASVVAVRVLNRRGSGTTSGVIAGVDYVGNAGSAGDVANMSLGGGVSQALDDAVTNAASGGVKFTLAAGNESDDANNHSPARANGPNVYTISAMDINDDFASFSNYGNPPVDYCAPGVSVRSTWKNAGYNTISGTSMAAPHAAGVLLLGNARTSGSVNNDPDGNADPIISR